MCAFFNNVLIGKLRKFEFLIELHDYCRIISARGDGDKARGRYVERGNPTYQCNVVLISKAVALFDFVHCVDNVAVE